MTLPANINTLEQQKFVENDDGDVAVRVMMTPQDPDLDALAGLSTNGLVTRLAEGSFTTRSVTAGTGISVANGSGVGGDPTVSLANTAVTAASYGTATRIPTIVFDAQGRATSASNTTPSFTDAEIAAGAAIARSKIATGTANYNVANDTTGALVSRPNAHNPRYIYEVYEEFLGHGNNSPHSYDWSPINNGAGANSSNVASGQGEFGVVSLNTGSTAAGRSALHLASVCTLFGGAAITFEARVRIPTLSTAGVEAFSSYVGYSDVFTAAAITNGAYWYTDGTFTNWNFVTFDGGTQTFTFTAIPSTTAWITLGFTLNAAGTSLQPTIAGVNVGSAITTNIPTAAGREVAPFIKILKTTGATTRAFEIDYMHITGVLTTARL